MRIRERPRAGIGFEQPVVQRRDVRHQNIGLSKVAKGLQGETVAIDVGGSVDAGGSRRGNLQTVLQEAGPIHFQHFDIHDDFGAGLQ